MTTSTAVDRNFGPLVVHDPAPSSSGAHAPGRARSRRDRGLDLIRAGALLRVFLWHGTAAVGLTWIAAMPVMFHVSGMLSASALSSARPWQLLYGRLRRLLIPLWLFSIAALGAIAATGHRLENPSAVWRWFVPLADPTGSTWENGWLSRPLWFLRCLLWLTLLLPLIGVVVRRSRAFGYAGAASVGVAAAAASSTLGASWWAAQDTLTYGAFFIWGAVQGPVVVRSTRGRVALAALAVAAGGVLGARPDLLPASGSVNDSHLTILLTGAAWVALISLLRPLIAAVAEHRWLRPLTDAASRRSLSIYLWHSPALAVAQLAAARAGTDSTPLILVAGAGLCAAALPVAGAVEDLAARRPPVRGRTALAARMGGAAAIVTVLVWVGAAPAALKLPPPSQAPAAPVIGDVPEMFAGAARTGELRDGTSAASAVDSRTAAELERATVDFARAHDIAGISVYVTEPGHRFWAGTDGVDADGGALTVDTPIASMSNAKAMTAAVLLRAAGDGLVDLDEPIGTLDVAPWFTLAAATTGWDLLSHRSGLVAYGLTGEYVSDPASVDGWEPALRAVERAGLQFPPGSRQEYSSTNYVVAGLYAAQIYGRPIESLLAELLDEQRVDAVVEGPSPGKPNTGTAGVLSTIAGYARWVDAMWRTHRAIPETFAGKVDDPGPNALGVSTVGFCPCWADGDRTRYAAVGSNGGTLTLRYYAARDVIIVIYNADSIWVDGRQDALNDFAVELLDIWDGER